MTKPKLSKNEQFMLDHFRYMQGAVLSVEDVAEAFYKHTGKPLPANWRSSTLAFIRTLNLKCHVLGLPRIERISRLGVGSQAQFVYREPISSIPSVARNNRVSR
jgi:hypothetical protein